MAAKHKHAGLMLMPCYNLKSCPFCGGTAEMWGKARLIWIECNSCDANTARFTSSVVAIQAWQFRHTPVAVRSLRAIRAVKRKVASTLIEFLILNVLVIIGASSLVDGIAYRNWYLGILGTWFLFVAAVVIWLLVPDQEDGK